MQDQPIENTEEQPEPWHKGPIKWILSIFLLLLIVTLSIPYYSIKLDPNPNYIPEIDEVIPEDIELKNKTANNYLEMLEPYDPLIKRAADRIVSKSGCQTKVCSTKATFYFVRDKFDYVNDPLRFEYLKSARESLVTQNGDCDDAAILAANLLQSIGIRTRFVFIPGHVYIEAHLPEALRRYKSGQDWVPLDLTCRYCEFGEVSWKTPAEKSYLE